MAQRHRTIGTYKRIVLPAHEALNQVARLEVRQGRGHHLTDPHAAHRLSWHDGLHIAAVLGQPDPLACVIPEIQAAHEDIPFAHLRHRSFNERKILIVSSVIAALLWAITGLSLCHGTELIAQILFQYLSHGASR